MDSKIVDPELDVRKEKKSLEEEVFTESDFTDDTLDDIYKRYKVATFELKDDIKELD
jgi:hypothetical protein